MHIYVYDSFLNQKKYDRTLAQIETRVTDLGLGGKICRHDLMTSLEHTISREMKRGVKTIIIIGNNQTLNKAVNAMAGSSICLGIIPIEKKDNQIASALGLQPGLEACDMLSARRIEKIDLGVANNLYFLSEASIKTLGTLVEINKEYSIETNENGIIKIINLPTEKKNSFVSVKSGPQDNKLELLIKTKNNKNILKKIIGQSTFSFEALSLINKSQPLTLDYSVEVSSPVNIKIAEEKINLIIGKKRTF